MLDIKNADYHFDFLKNNNNKADIDSLYEYTQTKDIFDILDNEETKLIAQDLDKIKYFHSLLASSDFNYKVINFEQYSNGVTTLSLQHELFPELTIESRIDKNQVVNTLVVSDLQPYKENEPLNLYIDISGYDYQSEVLFDKGDKELIEECINETLPSLFYTHKEFSQNIKLLSTFISKNNEYTILDKNLSFDMKNVETDINEYSKKYDLENTIVKGSSDYRRLMKKS